jgi:hypothetical protein
VAANGEDHVSATTRKPVVRQVVAESFPDLIPSRPYCCNNPRDGLLIRSRRNALRYRHIQFNGPGSLASLVFDIDKNDAYLAPSDAMLPEPNIMSINPKNGHGHASYWLSAPVGSHDFARLAPLRLYQATERGFARRLGADRFYAGLIAKNPLHPNWRTQWLVAAPYKLTDLAGWLDQHDMRPDPPEVSQLGAGRNIILFDKLRQTAYREVLLFKRESCRQAYEIHLLHGAEQVNATFPSPLSPAEVRSIARSVAKWTWKRFNESGLSRIQSARRAAITSRNEKKLELELGNYAVATTDVIANVLDRSDRTARRYKEREKQRQGVTPVAKRKPWEAEGVSRATWYRKRSVRECKED